MHCGPVRSPHVNWSHPAMNDNIQCLGSPGGSSGIKHQLSYSLLVICHSHLLFFPLLWFQWWVCSALVKQTNSSNPSLECPVNTDKCKMEANMMLQTTQSIFYFRQSYREEERDSSIPNGCNTWSLGQAGARSQQLHLDLPCGCRGWIWDAGITCRGLTCCTTIPAPE